MTNDHVYNLRAGRRTGAQALGKVKQILGRSVQVPRKPTRSRNWHFEELENRLTRSDKKLGRPRIISLERLEERVVPSLLSTFELDGNATSGILGTSGSTTASHDWDQVYTDYTGSTKNASGTNALFYTANPVNSSANINFTGGSTKDIHDLNNWQWNQSTPQGKDDLVNGLAAGYLDSSTGDTLLYVATDRYDNSGNATIGVWFLHNPIGTTGAASGSFINTNTGQAETHVEGDLLLVANFGGGGTPTITAYKWHNGALTAAGTLPSTEGFAIVNSVPFDGQGSNPANVKWPFVSKAGTNFPLAGEFFEAGVDLNQVFGLSTSQLPSFSSFIIETRSSSSQDATLSDFITGYVSSVPDVAVTKVADNPVVNAGATVGYTVTISNVGVGGLTGVTLSDLLPAGADLNWSIDQNDANNDFQITGSVGNQSLSLKSPVSLANDAAPLSVHITATTTSADVGALINTAIVAAANERPGFQYNDTATATINVVATSVSTVTSQNSVEGVSQTFNMGTFTSAAGGTATVDVHWGDGSNDTTFSFTDTAGVATTIPSQIHTYAEEGSYTVTETVTDSSGSSESGTFTATVGDAALTGSSGASFSGTENVSSTLSGATFTDANSNAPASDFTAVITWGDGGSTSTGVVTGSGGSYSVTGSHTYAGHGTYNISIAVTDAGGSTTTITGTATVGDAALPGNSGASTENVLAGSSVPPGSGGQTTGTGSTSTSSPSSSGTQTTGTSSTSSSPPSNGGTMTGTGSTPTSATASGGTLMTGAGGTSTSSPTTGGTQMIGTGSTPTSATTSSGTMTNTGSTPTSATTSGGTLATNTGNTPSSPPASGGTQSTGTSGTLTGSPTSGGTQTIGTGSTSSSSPASPSAPPSTGPQTNQTVGRSAVPSAPPSDAPNTGVTTAQVSGVTRVPELLASASFPHARFPGTYATGSGFGSLGLSDGAGRASDAQTLPAPGSSEMVRAPSRNPAWLYEGSMVTPIPSPMPTAIPDLLIPYRGPVDAVFSSDDQLGAFQSDLLWKHLDALDLAFELNGLDTTIEASIVLTAVAGFVVWSLCSNYLLAGALATTTPLWKRYSSFDPLVILDAWEKESKGQKQGQEDEETLQTLVSRAPTTLKPVGI